MKKIDNYIPILECSNEQICEAIIKGEILMDDKGNTIIRNPALAHNFQDSDQT